MQTVTPQLVLAWTHTADIHGSVFGVEVPVPGALIQMTLVPWALTFMYVSARSVGDGEYRSELLDRCVAVRTSSNRGVLVSAAGWKRDPSPGVGP
jgi:hypothetical protein